MVIPRNQILGDTSSGPRNHDTYGPRILAVCWLVEALSSVILGLRVYCKLGRSRQLWYDDYIVIAAWLFQTVDVILITVNVSLGEGQHIYNLDPAVLLTLGLNGSVSGTLSITAALLSKLSFGVSLLRLTNGFTKWFIWFLLVTMSVALSLSAIFIWVQCSPPAKRWHRELEGTCWDPGFTARYGQFSGIYSAVVNFALAFLPWPLIWSLNMQLREKLGIAVAMSMGVFAGVGAIAKVLQLPKLTRGDFTYYQSELVIWGTVESAVTIMAVSVPVLRVLVVQGRSLASPHYNRTPTIHKGSSNKQSPRFYQTDNAEPGTEMVPVGISKGTASEEAIVASR